MIARCVERRRKENGGKRNAHIAETASHRRRTAARTPACYSLLVFG